MLTVDALTVDARDPLAIAEFWRDALGWELHPQDDPDEVLVAPRGAPGAIPALLFVRVPDVKVTKNRLHLDLRPDDRDAEVARLVALGAREVMVGQGEDVTWVVLADPDGNEFCVLRALARDEAPA